MYSDVAQARRWVMPMVIEAQAAARPDQICISMVEGDSLSFGALRDDAARVAGLLAELGVTAGERVALMLPNDLDLIRAWAGIGRLGGVAVMINTELTHAFLSHPLRDSQPAALIIHESFLPAFEAIAAQLPAIAHILVAGGGDAGRGTSFEAWRRCAPLEQPLPAAHDAACIMYTSGTTGAPKGVIMPHAHCFLFGLGAVENLGVTLDDRYYIVLPLFHANGLLMQLCAALIAGAHATIRQRFSASAWLSDIRRSGATLTHTLGAVSAFVQGQPPSALDRDHRLRLILAAPNAPEHERQWRERFGIAEVVGAYGMTEVNIPLYGQRAEPHPGTCGRVYSPYFEVEIRDPETDFPVPDGEIGEIMVRPKMANGFMAGYFNLPDKTAEAWRNFWFHTGDAGRMSAGGEVTFIDRIKDCIRRRGENISASDIETAMTSLAGVAEAAAFAVPSQIKGGEDEIMLAVVQGPDGGVTPAAIAAHARRTMPRFAWPRYVVFREALPKTGTQKVRKFELRSGGVSADTVDLQSHYA